MTVDLQRMFGILERWNNNQVTPTLSKPGELSYRSNIIFLKRSTQLSLRKKKNSSLVYLKKANRPSSSPTGLIYAANLRRILMVNVVALELMFCCCFPSLLPLVGWVTISIVSIVLIRDCLGVLDNADNIGFVRQRKYVRQLLFISSFRLVLSTDKREIFGLFLYFLLSPSNHKQTQHLILLR